MGSKYQQLSMDERNRLQRGLNQGMSLRAVARELQRAPGTVSREYRRGWVGNSYDAVTGWETVWARRRRGTRKLVAGNALAERVTATILERKWSPEQVAGRLRLEHPEDQSQQASHETIYQYIICPPRRRAEGGTHRWASPRASEAPPPQSRPGPPQWHTEHAFHPRAARRGRGSGGTRPLGRGSHQGGFQRQRHRHTGRSEQPFRDPGTGR